MPHSSEQVVKIVEEAERLGLGSEVVVESPDRSEIYKPLIEKLQNAGIHGHWKVQPLGKCPECGYQEPWPAGSSFVCRNCGYNSGCS